LTDTLISIHNNDMLWCCCGAVAQLVAPLAPPIMRRSEIAVARLVILIFVPLISMGSF
jgi:hypothetical protein